MMLSNLQVRITGDPRQWLCSIVGVLSSTFILASYMFEAHIAVSFALSLDGRTRSLSVMSRLLAWIWLFAALGRFITRPDLAYGKWFGSGGMHCIEDVDQSMWLVVLFSPAVIILASYSVAAAISRKSNARVQRRVWSRTLFYFLAFAITNLPFMAFVISQPFFPEHAFWEVAERVLLRMSGFANVMVYILTSRYGQTWTHSVSRLPSAIDEGDPLGIASFRVRFGDSEEEAVERDQREANHRARRAQNRLQDSNSGVEGFDKLSLEDLQASEQEDRRLDALLAEATERSQQEVTRSAREIARSSDSAPPSLLSKQIR